MNNTTNSSSFDISFKLSGGLCGLYDESALVSYAIVLIILAILSTLENLLVIIVICKYEVLRSASILLIGVLAVIDFIGGGFVTPLKIWITLDRGRNLTIAIIRNFVWLFTAVIFLSLSTVFAISLDRSFQVFSMGRFKLTIPKMIGLLLLCWIIPFAIIICLMSGYFTFSLYWLSISYYAICVAGMIFNYIGMTVSIKHHASNTSDNVQSSYIESQREAMKTILIIISACILLNSIPIANTILAHSLIFSKTMCAFTYLALLGNSVVNPWIYFLRIPIIKQHILRFFNREASTVNSDVSDDAFFLEEAEDLQMESR